MKTLLLAGCGAAVLAAGTAVAGTGHQWGDYLWGSPGNKPTLTLRHKFADATASKWMPYYLTGANDALTKWNDDARSPLTLNELGEATHTTSSACNPRSGEITVCSDEYGTNQGWVGIANIWASGTSITQATARMNDSYYEYSTFYDTDGQRQFVVCHEIGHTFGLGHLDTNFNNANLESCMDYTSNPEGPPDNRDPGPVDWEVLTSATMYGPVGDGGGDPPPEEEPPTTKPGKGGGKGGGGGGGGGGGKGKNKLVAPPTTAEAALERGRFGGILGYDGAGRPNVYVQDMRGGQRKFTFVMWAEGYRPAGSQRPAGR
ncbi:reprolysin-like metallopeptidase [Sphingomicrobium aestuariivivum]|uniref:reprolysin-like metallopeptidase n=1 Tax=Sphingomicrobium aestuariivivum TaxID=1582356 RepID=UPI001FD6FB0D|nr:hypothetical protein [Sphingomicrobium aestuariivivum]MCJ8190738.1 hypothetical protein [Sphingomicrobium aestuariivivum]